MKLKFLFDEEEKEEKIKIGSQFGGGFGISDLIKKEKEKDISDIKPSTKLKFTADVGVGAKAMGGATLAKPVEVPSSQFGISDLSKPKRISPELQQKESLSFKMKELSTRKEQESFCYEILTGKKVNDIFTLPLEERRKALSVMTQLQRTAVTTTEKFNETVGTIGWIGALGIMGAQTVASLIKITPEIWRKLNIKVIDKKVPFKEGLEAILKTGHGEGTTYQRKIFDEAIKQAEVKNVGVVDMLKKGLTLTEAKPRFAFGTKLYSGIPADEMVNALVKTGKVTADIARELSLAKPELVSQVIQNLSIASPAIASKLAPELVKLIPKEEILKKVEPEVKEGIPKIEPKAPVEPPVKPVEEKIVGKGRIIPEKPKAEIKAPTELEMPEKQIIPATIEEAKEILKIDPKEPLVSKDMLAKKMVEKKVSIEDIEAVKGEKIDVKKPKDIIIALRDINAVKKEVIEEPTPKTIPKALEPLEVIPTQEVSKLLTAEEKYPERFAKQEIKEFKKFITEEEKEFIKAEEEYPAKIVKEEIEELQPLATPAQIKQAHAIADSKALISEKGKMKPQYREIAKIFTEQKSIKKMTREEAETFIDMLNRLPEPKYKAGKLVPPSIPRTMKLTTQDFFKKKYGEPTPVWLLTDQTYYATKLGIKPLVEPFEKGKQEFDLEFRQSSNLVDRMVNKLNAIAKTPGFERIRSKVKNIPTKAESKMAKLINKHEATPSGLSEKEEDIFKYFRNLSKDIWGRENEVREKVDLPPIKYKTAYFRHTADAMAKEMLEGKYPFPQGIKYWGEKMVGKKIFNPMEFHRKLSDDLIDLWSKDIRAVTKAMLWNGLKEIYLAQPAKFLNEQLNAISKDLPEYKNLTPREQAAYDQTKVMPASAKKWLINYINQVLKGQETELDASLNRIVTKSGLKGIFDKVLSPFGRTVGRKPITNSFSLSGRMIISGVMGWVPRQMIRNAFQQTQNLALYGVKATIKSILPVGIDKNLKGLLSKSLFMKSYTGFEELPVDLMGKLEKAWLYPYGVVANNNAKQGMKAAYWNILELIKNPKFKKHGWADPQRTKDTPKGFLYPGEKEKLSKEMEFGASATQYQYIPMGMPGVFRYKALIPLTRLQSWWMNYFTKFNREAIHRGLKGRPSWSGEDGPTLPWSRRVNFLKYVIIGGAILTALGYKKSFMLGVAPTYLSPAGQVALGFYNYVTADADWKREKALRQIYYSWKAFIPGSLAWRDFLAVWKGEKDLEEILFYGKKEKKKAQPPLKITIPRDDKLGFEEKIKTKTNTKLKFTF